MQVTARQEQTYASIELVSYLVNGLAEPLSLDFTQLLNYLLVLRKNPVLQK